MPWFLLALCLFRGLGANVSFPAQEPLKEVRAGYVALPRDRGIDTSTYFYIRLAFESFLKEKVSFVLLDLNTPGGEVFAALNIVQELHKMDEQHHIPVVALVDDWALSAGALLAYSCRYLGTTSQGSMGAAEPVLAGSDGKMESASEKMVSALRTEFAKAASFYGRNPLIAEAMVDKDMVLVERKGEIVRLLEDAQIDREDTVISSQGKLLTLDAEQLKYLKVADFIVENRSFAPLSGRDLLSKEPAFAFPTKWITYENWKVDFFAFLTHPMISSCLLFGFFFGLYFTLQSQVFGLSSVFGLICLLGVVLPYFGLALINGLELFLLLLGLGILVIDLLVFNSWVVGIFGFALALGGVVSLLLPSLAGISFSWNPAHWGVVLSAWAERLSLFLCIIFLSFILSLICSRFLFKKSFLARRLVLKEPLLREEYEEKLPAVSSIGRAISALRPLGRVEIEGHFYEAETEGEFIESGSFIRVIALLEQRKRVRVREEDR